MHNFTISYLRKLWERQRQREERRREDRRGEERRRERERGGEGEGEGERDCRYLSYLLFYDFALSNGIK